MAGHWRALAEEVPREATGTTPLELDVTSDASVAAAKAQRLGERPPRGRCARYNNAGVYGPRDPQSALDMDFDAWREVSSRSMSSAPLRVAQAFPAKCRGLEDRARSRTISSFGWARSAATPPASIAYRSSKTGG